MMYWLTENAFVPFLTGVFVTIILLLMAWSARSKGALYLALGIAALTTAVVVIEQMIETDREVVTEMIYELADHVRANDAPAIVRHVSPRHPNTIARVNADMQQYHADQCSIIGVNYFELAPDGKSATVDFAAFGQGKERRSGYTSPAQVRVVLHLDKVGGKTWKITDYTATDARSGVQL